MNHKVLLKKARTARHRQDDCMRRLAALSAKKHISEAEKAYLPRLRKAAHHAMQFSFRLSRRVAKMTGRTPVPVLMRAAFKVKTHFRKVRRLQGEDAALEFLLLSSDDKARVMGVAPARKGA